jgi:hypothetical protein
MGRFRLSIGRLCQLIAAVGVSLAALRHASSPWATLVFTTALAMLGYATLGAILRRKERRAFWIGFAATGWLYMLVSYCPVVSDFLRNNLATQRWLEWLHPRFIPFDRQPGAVSNQRLFVLKNPTPEPGMDIRTVSTSRLDVRVRAAGGGADHLLVGNVETTGSSGSGTVLREVAIRVDVVQEALLQRAEEEGATFILNRHSPSLFEWEIADATVDPGAFVKVGHALFVLLFAWIGGIAGRRLYRLDNTPV